MRFMESRLVSRIAGVSCMLALLCLAVTPARAESTLQALSIPTVTTAPPLDPKADVATWNDAISATLPWDVQHQRPSSETATARIATDGKNLFVRFDVPQREALLAQQHANDVGDGTDDEVWIDLWPNGNSGFYYQFAATSSGTHYQYSSENTAYAPTWETHGNAYSGGFTVTMRIPISVMRGSGNKNAWKMQFVRIVRSTGERQIWSYAAAQTNGDDVNYAGQLNGLASAVAVRPPPRVALYGLGAVGPSSSGLTTSRAGADLSIPVTATSSFYATLHPDFSNVEVDQQTIAPTAFARSFNEVRPFFTQASNFLDPFNCTACPGITELYTPSIPTPRDGYAVEGKQGPLSFAAFDAIGVGRGDGAAAFSLHSPDNHWQISEQSVVTNLPGVTDHLTTTGLSYSDSKHISTYFNYGSDSGTNVLAGNQAQRYDAGLFYYTNTLGLAVSARKVGEFYNPIDGLIQHPDIEGYGLYENKIFLFDKNAPLNSIQIGTFIDRYRSHLGLLDQTDNAAWIDVLTRNLIDIQFNSGSDYLLLNSGVFTPISQPGASITWHSGSANNPGSNENHGSSATPTSISYNAGQFGPGRVETWFRSSTMRAGPRGTLSLEADDTRDYLAAGGTNIQWLERLGYTYTPGPMSSLAVGVRRIIGTGPVVDAAAPPAFTSAWNLSFAFHRRLPHDELYVAYGDASQLSTVPQFIIKIIHYFGAEKGT
jgi:hypothetical protein